MVVGSKLVQRVRLDSEPPAVKEFLRTLNVGNDGVELEIAGQVICKVIPALKFSEAEKAALLKERWEMIRKARQRNKSVPANVIEREVREAVDDVRKRKKTR
jgi:hypothetical protein